MLQVVTAKEYVEWCEAARYEKFLRTGDPNDVAMYLHEHGTDIDEVWTTITGARIADRVARVRLEMQAMGFVPGDGPDDTSLLGLLSVYALDSAAAYLRDHGTGEGRALGGEGFGSPEQTSAYALAEALERFDPTSHWRYVYDDRTKRSYVLDGNARRTAAKAKRGVLPKGEAAPLEDEKKVEVNGDSKACSAAARKARASAKPPSPKR